MIQDLREARRWVGAEGTVPEGGERYAPRPGSRPRPPVADLRKALAQVDRQIANIRGPFCGGQFASLETALGAAEQRRATLQADLAQLDGKHV